MSARVALVTGSAQGIGRAIAEALIASGHVVIGVDVREQAGHVFDLAFGFVCEGEAPHERAARRPLTRRGRAA